jgi:hypothetical protein
MNGLDALGDASPYAGLVPAVAGGALTILGTVVARFLIPVGSVFHRHAALIAGGASALIVGLATQSYTGAVAGLGTGVGMWGGERLLEWQAKKLLPEANGG